MRCNCKGPTPLFAPDRSVQAVWCGTNSPSVSTGITARLRSNNGLAYGIGEDQGHGQTSRTNLRRLPSHFAAAPLANNHLHDPGGRSRVPAFLGFAELLYIPDSRSG